MTDMDPDASAAAPQTKDEDPDTTGADVSALRAAIEKADRLIAHYHHGVRLGQDLKRTLVLRLLHTQYPRLSIDEEAKLLKSYGVAPEPRKT